MVMIQAGRDRVGGPVVLRRGSLAVAWDAGGVLTLTDATAGQTRVHGVARVELAARGHVRKRLLAPAPDPREDSPRAIPPSDLLGSGLQVERRLAVAESPLTLRATLRVYEAHELVRLALRLEHTGLPDDAPIAVERVFPFVTGAWWRPGSLLLGGRTADFAAYKNGWQSWSYAGGLPPGKRDPRPRDPTLVGWHSPGGRRVRAPASSPVSGGVDVVSEEMGMVGGSELPVALLAGFADANEWVGQVLIDRREGALAAAALLDGATLGPGESIALPPLLLGLGPPRELPPRYAVAVGRELGARAAASPTPTGWCSWYYYFTGVSETDILENLAALSAERGRLPLEVVQIDDGYQTAVGDWTSVNERFPSGMAALAARIRDAGYRPGIWLAPFTVLATSRIAREHPDWFVQDAQGQPAWAGENWDAPLHGLDTSHPGARDWLRRLFTTVVEEWGYDYLKLDFLASAAMRGRRRDPLVTRARALREGLALIRETVGERVFLLGCGCPLLAGVGLLDALRIGPDSAPYWPPYRGGRTAPLGDGHALPATEGALRTTLTRAWLDPAWWHNDPDCLLLRRDASALTLDEIRAFATAVGLTGGMALLSDRIAELPDERIELAAKLLPPLDVHAQPLDPFAWGIPERIVGGVERPWASWTLVGLFNGRLRQREMGLTWSELGLRPGRYHATEFWSGAYLGAHEDGVRVRVGAHGAAALRVTPVLPHPQLIGDTFHIGQGAVDVSDWRFEETSRTLHWRASLGRDASGAFRVALPAGWRVQRVTSVTSVTSAAESLSWRQGERGELVVSARIRGEAEFVAELADGGALS